MFVKPLVLIVITKLCQSRTLSLKFVCAWFVIELVISGEVDRTNIPNLSFIFLSIIEIVIIVILLLFSTLKITTDSSFMPLACFSLEVLVFISHFQVQFVPGVNKNRLNFS